MNILATPCDMDGVELDNPSVPPPPRDRNSNLMDYTPFAFRAEFELAEFLYKKAEMSAALVDQLMEILVAYFSRYEDEPEPPFKGQQDLLDRIDAITLGEVPWDSFTAKYTGPVPDTGPTPEWMTEEFEIHFRDIHALAREMISNPDFKDEFDFTPYQEFEDGKRRWSDFMSGNWCWRQAVSDWF